MFIQRKVICRVSAIGKAELLIYVARIANLDGSSEIMELDGATCPVQITQPCNVRRPNNKLLLWNSEINEKVTLRYKPCKLVSTMVWANDNPPLTVERAIIIIII